MMARCVGVYTLVLHPQHAVSTTQQPCSPFPQFDASLNCTSKLVVTLAVEAGAALATSTLDFDIACVGSASGACPCTCDPAADAACACRDLTSPLRITVTKTPAYATYPLNWVRSFNSKPTEAITRTGVGWPSLTCVDGVTSAAPTCGWAVDYTGARVPDSQGFCCACTLDGLVGGTIGGGDGSTTRGGLNCDLLASFLIEPGSAHCLRNDPLWYEGYEMGGVQVDFDITVSVKRGGGGATPTTSSNITLSPAVPAAALPTVAARLLGDLSSYEPPPDFGGGMLFIPHPPGASLTTVLTTNTFALTVVDKSLVSVDGGTCDRVGTSYPAFRSQAAACGSRPGTCLSNQLADLAASDAAAVAAGRPPRYSVTRWGGGQAGAKQAFKRTPSGPLWLGLPLPSTTASLVTLSVDAANVTLVTNAAPARLVNGSVCTGRQAAGSPPPAVCGSFEALVSDATLAVTLVNDGVVDSDYTVAVANCSGAPVLPPAGQYVSTRARETLRLSFDLHSTSMEAVKSAACTVTATDATGKLAAALVVPFSVNATVIPSPPSNGGGAGDGGGGTPTPRPTCAQACPSWTQWGCRWANSCWRQLGSAIAGVVLGVAAGLLVLWGGVRGWWCRAVRWCWPRRTGAVVV